MSRVTPQEGLERLKTLYSVMAGIPAQHVDLSTWRKDGNGRSNEVEDTILLRHSCGTTGCAVGFAAAYPPFRAMGLGYDADEGSPTFNGRYGMDAVVQFFGLRDMEQMGELFYTHQERLHDDPHSTATSIGHKRAILQRIRNFLRRRGAITKERVAELRAYEATLDAKPTT